MSKIGEISARKWDSSPHLAVNALDQALPFPREGCKGSASISSQQPVSFQGPEQQNWPLAAIPSQTQLVLLLELPRNSTSPKSHLSCISCIWEQFAPQSCSCVLLNCFRGYIWFCFGALFCDNAKPEWCLWPRGGWKRIRGQDRQAVPQSCCWGRQDVLCKSRCILY